MAGRKAENGVFRWSPQRLREWAERYLTVAKVEAGGLPARSKTRGSRAHVRIRSGQMYRVTFNRAYEEAAPDRYRAKIRRGPREAARKAGALLHEGKGSGQRICLRCLRGTKATTISRSDRRRRLGVTIHIPPRSIDRMRRRRSWSDRREGACALARMGSYARCASPIRPRAERYQALRPRGDVARATRGIGLAVA